MPDYLLFLALLPGILIIIYIFRKDKVEHEPVSLIVKLIVFGAVSCIPAIFAENYMTAIMPAGLSGVVEYAVYDAFIVAALCEEVCKYVLLRIGSWNNINFDYRFDGIVYGVSVAVGFALLENILYVMDGGIQVALMRGVLAVPLHAFCGVFMGVFYGAAKRYSVGGRGSKALSCKVMAIFVPIMIHGLYDTFAMIGSTAATVILLVFVVIMYIVAIKCVNKFSREDAMGGFYGYTMPLSDLWRNK